MERPKNINEWLPVKDGQKIQMCEMPNNLPWFELHWSTYIVIVLVGALTVWTNRSLAQWFTHLDTFDILCLLFPLQPAVQFLLIYLYECLVRRLKKQKPLP